MKDRKARWDIENLCTKIREIDGELERSLIHCLSIKDCPKCEHKVLAQSYVEIIYGKKSKQESYFYDETRYQCLTCGSKFTCSEKCVCELIEDA